MLQATRIRIGSEAPNFIAVLTEGKIDFHEYMGHQWIVLFSHPADFTPVCTTSGSFARLCRDFSKRGAKLIGLSTEDMEDHKAWIRDTEDVTSGGAKFTYIIADADRKVAFLYDMCSASDFENIGKGIIPNSRMLYWLLIQLKGKINHDLSCLNW